MNHFAFYLFAFSLGAFTVPIISRLFRLPSMIGEILYGMLLSYLFYTTSVDLEFIDFLAELGFIFLMFLAGLEINFDQFSLKNIKKPILSVLLFFVATYALILIGLMPGSPFYILLITATSVGLVFLGLKLENSVNTPFGQELIWIATLGELVTIFIMIVLEVSYRNFDPLHVIKDVSGIFALLVVAYLFLRIIIYLFWRFPRAVAIFDSDDNVSELGVRLAFMILLMMVALSAFFKLELILGAFLGGMMLSFAFRDKHDLEKKLSSIGYGFFTPFFFIKVGWDFKLQSDYLAAIIQNSLMIYGLIYLSRLPAGLLYLLARGKALLTRLRLSLASSLLLASPLTLLVAIAKLGKEINLVDEIIYNSIILAAMLGAIIGPLGFALLAPKEQK